MLLNPKKVQNQNDISVGAMEAQDPFDHPIPGQSLTDEPGKWAFEKPPEFTDVDDAVDYVVEQISENPEAIEKFEKLMITGMPIESIVNTISFSGFSEGRWTPDIAELIKPPLSAFFVILAELLLHDKKIMQVRIKNILLHSLFNNNRIFYYLY